MAKNGSMMERLDKYVEAYSVIAPLIVHAQVLGLLQGAYSAGMLDAALTPVSVEAIANKAGIDGDRVQDICRVLAAHGIFVKENTGYRLDEPWALLVTSDFIRTFQVTLDDAFAKARAFAQLGDSYWQMPSEDRVMLAKGVTFNPTSPITSEFYEMLLHDMLPDVAYKLAHQETRYLELGCGVGGGLNGMLRTYPRMTAVAVDIAGDVLAEAQSTAEALGLSDRVRFIHDDARNFDEKDAFDLVYWSQFFFPEPTRADVLRVARAALKPSGYLFAPLLSDRVPDEELNTAQAKHSAMAQLIYGAWDVPRLSADTIKTEIEAAGFINVAIKTEPYMRLVVAQRPVTP